MPLETFDDDKPTGEVLDDLGDAYRDGCDLLAAIDEAFDDLVESGDEAADEMRESIAAAAEHFESIASSLRALYDREFLDDGSENEDDDEAAAE